MIILPEGCTEATFVVGGPVRIKNGASMELAVRLVRKVYSTGVSQLILQKDDLAPGSCSDAFEVVKDPSVAYDLMARWIAETSDYLKSTRNK